MYSLLFRALTRLPAEPVHEVVFGALRATMALPGVRPAVSRALAPRDPGLRVHALGTVFPGPVGLAAGFDKDARGPDALVSLGFAFVEVGTVTPLPQPGNPRPRVFRLSADRALVNRMGFPSEGVTRVAARLEQRRGPAIVGVNIGKNKATESSEAAADFAQAALLLAPHTAFSVVNVSSPNTPGLRDLQRPEVLGRLLEGVRAALDEGSPERRVPLLVKLAPDLDDGALDAIADLARSLKLDGVVAVNTTVRRDGLASTAQAVAHAGDGGLSGAPLAARAREVLARLRARLGPEPCIISAGGIETADEAWDRIAHGATLLELYTGFVYGGPLVAHRIHAGLVSRLREHGYACLDDARGCALASPSRAAAAPAREA